MSQTHLHLMISHLPIFGSILGALILMFGLWNKSKQTYIAAYFLFIISAVGGTIAYFTGESAEESVERLQGISKNTIHVHEDSALLTLVSILVLGALSVFSLVATYKENFLARKAATATLIISLISFGFAARTGWLGGKIRHSEIVKSSVQNTGASENNDD